MECPVSSINVQQCERIAFCTTTAYEEHVAKEHGKDMNSSDALSMADFTEIFPMNNPNRMSQAQYHHLEYKQQSAGTKRLFHMAFLGGVVPPTGQEASIERIGLWANFTKEMTSFSQERAARNLSVINQIRQEDKEYYMANALCHPTLTSKKRPLELPANSNDLRNTVFRGKFSIRENLPRPRVLNKGTHTLVLPSEIIKHALALDPNKIDLLDEMHLDRMGDTTKHTSRNETPRTKAILEDFHGLLSSKQARLCLVFVWTDGFERNNTKRDRDSCNCITMTLFMRDEGTGKTTCQTFVLSLRWKGADPKVIHKAIVDDLITLAKDGIKVYHKGTKSVFPLYVVPYAILIDFAERGPTMGLASHSGHHAKIWGYGGNVYKLVKKLRSCNTCLLLLLKGVKLRKNCPHCISFDVSECPKYVAPEDFPQEKLENVEARTISFERLCDSKTVLKYCEEARKKYEQGTWAKKVVQSYLKTKVVSPKTTETILQSVDSGIDWEPPPFLTLHTTKLNDVIDAFMHLVFLGMVRCILKAMLNPFVKRRGATNILAKKLEPVFNVLVNFNLEWLKLMDWKEGASGGLVSENYMGLAKIFPYLGDLVEETVKKPLPPGDTHLLDMTQVVKWKKKECEDWLRERALLNAKSKRERLIHIGQDPNTHSKMKKDDLVKWIVNLCNNENGPPPVIEFWAVPTLLISCLLASMGALVTQLMMRSVTNEACDKAFIETQLFLNIASKVETAIAREDGKNKDGSQSLPPNFYSAPNLSREVLRKYGSGRVVWEGGPQGEGAIRGIRSFLSQPKKSTALASAHVSHLEAATLEQIESSMSSQDQQAKEQKRKNYHVYLDDELDEALATHIPLSGVVLRSGHVGVMVKERGKSVMFRQIAVGNQPVKSKTGITYWKVAQPDPAKDVTAEDIYMFMLCLPQFVEEGVAKNVKYHIISSEWQHLQIDEEKKAPVWLSFSCQENSQVKTVLDDVSADLERLAPLQTGTDDNDSFDEQNTNGDDAEIEELLSRATNELV